MIKITKNGDVVVPDACWSNIPNSISVTIEMEPAMDVSHLVAVKAGKDLKWNEPTQDQVKLFTQVFMLARRVGWIK